ncbi:MAG TPA: inositol monophosphatase family protein [Candidatus Limnocylindrales bacterium]
MTAEPIERDRDAAAEDAAGEWAGELEFAVTVGRAAGELLMDHYERLERIDYKSAKDVVTEADHLSERLILDAVRERFPADAILAEESGAHARHDGSTATAPKGRTWVVDPLDGTVNYANGIPYFCVSVALVADGTPVVGVIVDPARDELFAAAAGAPATLDGAPIAASDKDRIEDFVISLALGGRRAVSRARAVRKRIRVSRSMGAAALSLAYVGNGRFDAFVQSRGLSAWDVAAAGLIAERGGGRVTNLEGGPWFDLAKPNQSLGVLAVPPAHHAELLELVR